MPCSKFTSAFVADLPPSPTKAAFYRDALLGGFAVRVSGQTKTYIAEGTVRGGSRVRCSLGHAHILSCEAARNLARVRLGEMAAGVNPLARDRDKRAQEQRARAARRAADGEVAITLRRVLDDYLAARDLKPSTRHDYTTEIPRLLGDWLPLPVTANTRDMIESRYKSLCARP